MQLLQTISIFCLLALANTKRDGLTVETAQGNVVGTKVSSGVRRFLGIPYAVASRWEAPQVPPNRTDTFKASTFGHACPQGHDPVLDQFGAFLEDKTNTTEAEDCLSINIWAPSTARKQKTAVMVLVYGGGFLIGKSSTSIYDGQRLVQNYDDVTVVSFNYRVTVFGQPGAPQFLENGTQAQNFGLLDIDAAVQWVYDNIASFGGDPERIILFGESAGAAAIDPFTYSHPEDKRVKGVIMQSGNLRMPGITGAYSGNTTFDPKPWNTLANAVGCGNNNVTDAAQFDCVKKVPWKDLNAAVTSNNLSFIPVADGVTLFNDTANRAEAGNFLHVPTLTGTTKDEADNFIVAFEQIGLNKTLPYLTEILADITTLLLFSCTTSQTAADRLAAEVPIWRYSYDAIFNQLSLYPDLRAYHGSELPILFDNYNKTLETKTGDALAKYVQRAWVSFAQDPAEGLTNYGWPPYSPNTTSVVQLGGFYNRTGASFVAGQDLDYTCSSESQRALGQTLVQLSQLLGPAGNAFLTPGSS